jgi:hypothetical protein
MFTKSLIRYCAVFRCLKNGHREVPTRGSLSALAFKPFRKELQKCVLSHPESLVYYHIQSPHYSPPLSIMTLRTGSWVMMPKRRLYSG